MVSVIAGTPHSGDHGIVALRCCVATDLINPAAGNPAAGNAAAGNPAAGNADHWYLQGAEALECGSLELASEAFWRCLALDASHASALHLLGKVRARQGQLEAALQRHDQQD